MFTTTSARLFFLALLTGGLLASCSDDSSARPIELGAPEETNETGQPGAPDKTGGGDDSIKAQASLDGLTTVDLWFHDYRVVRGPNDECTALDGTWVVDFRASTLAAAKRCAEPTAEHPNFRWVTQHTTLGASDLAALKQKLGAIKRLEASGICSYDMPASAAMSLNWPDQEETYVERDYACISGPSTEVDSTELYGFIAAVRDLGRTAPLGVASGVETSLTLTHEGAGVKGPGDECVGDQGSWRVDFEASAFRVSSCRPATVEVPTQHLEVNERWLFEDEKLTLRAALAAVRREAPPVTCVDDALENRLTLTDPSGNAAYIGASGGCRYGDSVITVNDDALSALIGRLRAIAEP
jgi:hypothetical protein